VLGGGGQTLQHLHLGLDRADRLQRVVAEGGPQLTHALFAAGVLDELCLTTSPMVVGGTGPRLVAGAALDWPVRMRLGHVLVAGDELLMRYVREGA